MLDKPLISIIIPYYNSDRFLEMSLESILGQSYENIEVVAVNNLSTDNSQKIVESFAKSDARVKMYDCDIPGVAAARNKALEVARGLYFMFVDSDDCIPKDSVELLYEIAGKESADMVCGAYYSCYGAQKSEKKVSGLRAAKLCNREEIHRFFLTEGRNYNQPWAKLIHRDLYKGVVYPEGKIYEDIAVLPTIIDNAHICVITEKPVYYYIQRSDSISYTSKVERQMDGITARLENASFYEKFYPKLTGYANDCALEYGFYLLGRIYRSGLKENMRSWDYTVDRIESIRQKGTGTNKAIKGALCLFAISPRFAGWMFSQYSRIKNRTK